MVIKSQWDKGSNYFEYPEGKTAHFLAWSTISTVFIIFDGPDARPKTAKGLKSEVLQKRYVF